MNLESFGFHLLVTRALGVCWLGRDEAGNIWNDSAGRRADWSKTHGFVQSCGISSALALEIPQVCTKPHGFVQSCGISSALALEIP